MSNSLIIRWIKLSQISMNTLIGLLSVENYVINGQTEPTNGDIM